MPEPSPRPAPEPSTGRTTTAGPGRVIVAVYAIFAVAAGSRAASTIIRRFAEAPLAYSLSAFSAAVYLLAAVALARNARLLAWIAIGIEAAGVVVIGTLSVVWPELFPADTVWSRYGMGYLFIPVVLPILGMLWLWRTRPSGPTPIGDRASA